MWGQQELWLVSLCFSDAGRDFWQWRQHEAGRRNTNTHLTSLSPWSVSRIIWCVQLSGETRQTLLIWKGVPLSKEADSQRESGNIHESSSRATENREFDDKRDELIRDWLPVDIRDEEKSQKLCSECASLRRLLNKSASGPTHQSYRCRTLTSGDDEGKERKRGVRNNKRPKAPSVMMKRKCPALKVQL